MSTKKLPERSEMAINAILTLVNRPHWMRASDASEVLNRVLENLTASFTPSEKFVTEAEALCVSFQELADFVSRHEAGSKVEAARQNCRAKVDDLAKALLEGSGDPVNPAALDCDNHASGTRPSLRLVWMCPIASGATAFACALGRDGFAYGSEVAVRLIIASLRVVSPIVHVVER